MHAICMQAGDLIHVECPVKIRVVNVAFPAQPSARFLEIGTHDNDYVVRKLIGEDIEFGTEFHGSDIAVNGARAHDD